MTDQDASPPTVVRVERVLPAPPKAVFDAWTSPELVATWLSPTGKAEVEADVRVGGRFRITMLGDGMRIDHHGEYLTVDPPRRLVFTWNSPYTGRTPSIVTVDLEPAGARTRLVLTHEQLPPKHRDAHGNGWGSILANLTVVLVGASAESPASTPQTLR